MNSPIQNPKSKIQNRIGVFGGSFDPIHIAHLRIAQAALHEAGLDRILFVVAAHPPHKLHGTVASAEDRYAMVEAALTREPRMEPCRVELDRPGPSYTVQTLQAINADHPGAELHLILGMDSLVDLPGWRDPKGILERARLLVVPRPGEWNIPNELKGRYRLLPFDEVALSSTDVRERMHVPGDVETLVPAAVLRYIREKGIYGVHG